MSLNLCGECNGGGVDDALAVCQACGGAGLIGGPTAMLGDDESFACDICGELAADAPGALCPDCFDESMDEDE